MVIAAIVLAAAIAFGASLGHGFVYDDFAIFADPYVTSRSTGWFEVWRIEQTRPLTYLTFWFNFALGGEDPAGYHAVNLVLHLGNVWLASTLLRRLLPSPSWQLAAVLFAVHPLQSEPVNYVFARATLLMTLFCLLALGEWLKNRTWYSVAWFAAALLAKEECAAFPLVLLALHWSMRREREELKPIAVMLLLSLAAGLRTIWATQVIEGVPAGAFAGITPLEYLSAQGPAILRYLRLIVWPAGLSVEPGIARDFAWAAWIAVLAILVISLRSFRNAGAGFWCIAGLLLLLPSSSIFPVPELAADRRMYLPMFGFAASASLIAARFTWMPIVICLALLPVSLFRTQVWGSGERLWREALDQSPYSVRPRLQLARIVPTAEGIRLLEGARKYNPDSPLVASELGRLHLSAGAAEVALQEFGRALALAPNSAQAISNRGVALMLLKQPEAAAADFTRALGLQPCLLEARINAARAGLNMGPPPRNCRYSEAERNALAEALTF
ncbi:MAG TPA: hypothetical protein VEQ63_02235 [Bryobacteraceae bacterium]|nr:hypothetical protein [Bryobacteraceae bacterium]